jgi:hypothetical protein
MKFYCNETGGGAIQVKAGNVCGLSSYNTPLMMIINSY